MILWTDTVVYVPEHHEASDVVVAGELTAKDPQPSQARSKRARQACHLPCPQTDLQRIPSLSRPSSPTSSKYPPAMAILPGPPPPALHLLGAPRQDRPTAVQNPGFLEANDSFPPVRSRDLLTAPQHHHDQHRAPIIEIPVLASAMALSN